MSSRALKKEKLDTLSPAQLETKLKETNIKMRKMRFDKVTAAVDDPSQMRKLRRSRARMMTLLREYELGIYEFDNGQRIKAKGSEA